MGERQWMKVPEFTYEPRDLRYQERTTKLFYSMPFVRHLGLEIVSVAPGQLDCAVTLVSALTQQHGFGHAGLVATMVDMSAGVACYTLIGPDQDALSSGVSISLLRPAKGERLVARGRVIKAGRTQSYAESWVFGVTGDRETLVARGHTAIAIVSSADKRLDLSRNK